MTDRELLELAAKGVGLRLQPRGRKDGNFLVLMNEHGDYIWNPLTDDGDAFRLAVKLGLVVCVLREIGITGIYLPAEHIVGKYDITEHHGSDPFAATRRAIVRAAVEYAKASGLPV